MLTLHLLFSLPLCLQQLPQEEPAQQDELQQQVEEPVVPDLAPLREPGLFQADWGIAAVVRTGEIAYATENDSVSSFVPMMFYEGETVFLRGLSGGIHAWKSGDMEVNAIAQMRFVDIPSEYQNQIQGDTFDFGLQFRTNRELGWWEVEALTDSSGRWRLGARAATSGSWGGLLYSPSLDLRYLSDRFTSEYYELSAVTGRTANASFQLSPAVLARYHVFSDLYLVGSLRYTWFSSEITSSPVVNEGGVAEAMLGFGFFQDSGDPQFLGNPVDRTKGTTRLEAEPYVRLAHGWATPSDLGSILGGDIEDDEYNNQMTSVFYGHPLTDSLFGAPIEVYLSPGFAWHHASEVQNSTQELVLLIKAYYTVPWPIRWRIGAAEGASWIDEVTYIERVDMEEKGYRPSQWMNYIDLSLDLNVGDLFGVESWEGLWFGASVHHRSSIFESASQFGRIKGGSNYPSIYLQWDL